MYFGNFALWSKSIPVEHLGLKLGKLVLQVREFFGQSFDNAWVNSAHKAIIWGTQVLWSWNYWMIIENCAWNWRRHQASTHFQLHAFINELIEINLVFWGCKWNHLSLNFSVIFRILYRYHIISWMKSIELYFCLYPQYWEWLTSVLTTGSQWN